VETRPGFQWGCLASNIPSFRWDEVAQAQLNAGASGSLQDQILFDNSFRGLPLSKRRRGEKWETTLKRHITKLPDKKEIKYRLFAADTQDDCFWWCVRGYDEKFNSYLLDCGKAVRTEDLARAWDAKYYGEQCVMGIIDAGGHRAREVGEFVGERAGMFMYKGTRWEAQARWRTAKDSNRLILANANVYKAELLYNMYSAENKGNHYFYLKEDLPDFYWKQMLDHKPNNKKRDGAEFPNWISNGNDHLFDCEKMLVLLHEMYRHFDRKKKRPRERRKVSVQN
jgi:hypothetical protein